MKFNPLICLGAAAAALALSSLTSQSAVMAMPAAALERAAAIAQPDLQQVRAGARGGGYRGGAVHRGGAVRGGAVAYRGGAAVPRGAVRAAALKTANRDRSANGIPAEERNCKPTFSCPSP